MTRRLWAIIVTYQRPEAVKAYLKALAEQSRAPDQIVLVDNSPRHTRADTDVPVEVTYLAMEENCGPAGGLAAGMRYVLEHGSDDDVILLGDDDDPPRNRHDLERLAGFLEEMATANARVGGTGLRGARLDRRKGLLRRIQDDELSGPVPVDVIAGNQLPIYRLRAVREAGPMRDELFFGFEELEFGLRLAAHGWTLTVDGDHWRGLRIDSGRFGGTSTDYVRRVSAWRRYYSVRNYIVVLRTYRYAWQAALYAFAVLAKGLLKFRPHRPESRAFLAAEVTAVRDAMTNRLGRTVLPP